MMSRCGSPKKTIYQSLYVQGRGALKRELTACLRTGRALREPRARTRRSGRSFVTDEVRISQRPAEAEDRAVPGHWEGDPIIGLDKSAIGTLVERTSRYTMPADPVVLADGGEGHEAAHAGFVPRQSASAASDETARAGARPCGAPGRTAARSRWGWTGLSASCASSWWGLHGQFVGSSAACYRRGTLVRQSRLCG